MSDDVSTDTQARMHQIAINDDLIKQVKMLQDSVGNLYVIVVLSAVALYSLSRWIVALEERVGKLELPK
jgi:hypothetical protein